MDKYSAAHNMEMTHNVILHLRRVMEGLKNTTSEYEVSDYLLRLEQINLEITNDYLVFREETYKEG